MSDSIAEIIITDLLSKRKKKKKKRSFCMELEHKQSVCVCVCVCVCARACTHGELFANFTEKDHQLAHQLGGVTTLKATLSL